ncbi:MAG TPA: EF-hand domain-containing protein [Pseudonocardiaceae bacterium]|nr:EF-hand domain-containing protein [Pseudonocardiaceae bacterium]
MASEFQRAKIRGVFRAMDVDGDGLLERSDFQALSDRWTGLRGWAPGSAPYSALSAVMLGWWSALAGAEAHEKVSLEDVLLLVDQLGEMSDAVKGTATAMFDAIDENGDEEISASEYRQLIEAWNGRRTDTDEIFPLLDLNGDGHISRAEFTELWTEFWAGDDPNAPGTWVFGRFDLPATTSG